MGGCILLLLRKVLFKMFAICQGLLEETNFDGIALSAAPTLTRSLRITVAGAALQVERRSMIIRRCWYCWTNILPNFTTSKLLSLVSSDLSEHPRIFRPVLLECVGPGEPGGQRRPTLPHSPPDCLLSAAGGNLDQRNCINKIGKDYHNPGRSHYLSTPLLGLRRSEDLQLCPDINLDLLWRLVARIPSRVNVEYIHPGTDLSRLLSSPVLFLSTLISRPSSLLQTMSGWGLPVARHSTVTLLPSVWTMSELLRLSTIRGGTGRDKSELVTDFKSANRI